MGQVEPLRPDAQKDVEQEREDRDVQLYNHQRFRRMVLVATAAAFAPVTRPRLANRLSLTAS